MADEEVKYVQLIRNEAVGFGFSVVGGAGCDLPPVIYDILEDSPAAECGKLEAGDVIIEVNNTNVVSLTTKEVLKCLRLSNDAVKLKLRKDPEIKERVQLYLSECPSPCRNNARKRMRHHQNNRLSSVTSDSNDSGNMEPTYNLHNGQQIANKNIGNEENVPPVKIDNRFSDDSDLTNNRSSKSKSPRFETFVMTGDLIIHLDRESSNKDIIIPPKLKQVDRLKALSTPSSPGDRRVDKKLSKNVQQTRDDSGCTNSAVQKPDQSGDNASSNRFPGIVRTSKSEDHLQKALTAVNVNIDDSNGIVSSSSINNLLDTSDNDRIVWTYNDPANSPDHSSSTQSPHSSSATSPTSATFSSPVNGPRVQATNGSELKHSDGEIRVKESAQNDKSELSDDDPYPDKKTVANNSSNNKLNNSSSSGESEQSEILLSFHSKPTKVDVDANKVYMHVRDNPNNTAVVGRRRNNRRDQSPPTDSETVSDEVPYRKLDDFDDFSSSSNGSNGTNVIRPSVPSPSVQTDEDFSDIESLHSFHYSPKAIDMPSAVRLAKRLIQLDGFKKSDVSKHLSKNNDFARVVAEEYLSYFNFKGDSLDEALRKFLKKFALTGETQERERVLVHFSKRYLDCNPGIINSQDAVHTLTCALMLLNTDLHSDNVPRKMTCPEFIENLYGLNEGENYPREMLKNLYQSIKSHQLEWAVDDDDVGGEEKVVTTSGDRNKNGNNSPSNISSVGSNPFLQIPNATNSKEYKKGYVMRKCCIDPNGKKTPVGKRGWRMFYATLRDMVLYLHKDEQGFRTNQLYENIQNSIRIHHSMATHAVDYKKKQHVFRLQTADMAQYLFQTSDSKELQSWIDTINFVASSLSAPPLASAVGSQKKFQRPLLPVSHTRFNMHDQLKSHEEHIAQIESDFQAHCSFPPERGSKARIVQDYRDKYSYLQNEIVRYNTYVYLLRSKLPKHSDVETSLVETSITEHDEPGENVQQSNEAAASSPVRQLAARMHKLTT
ncbi:efa-6 (predicted) [Pycnogonum litorale]